jgi:Carboxypeptidase regulatory-like domain
MKATIRWVSVAISAAAVFVAGCNSHDTVQNTKMDYEGTVTDASTGAPIAGASVTTVTCEIFSCAFPAVGITDAQGHYTVFGQCYSNNALAVTAEGYVPSGRDADCGQDRQVADFALTRSP